MSARRSKQTVLIRKYGKMADQYQARINRQAQIIDRLVEANAVQGDALYAVEHKSKTVKEARKVAKEATDKVKDILAVPEGEERG